MSDKELGGVWRTVMGRRIFIKDGQSLQDAMRESGKFRKDGIKKKLSEQLGDKQEKKYIELPKKEYGKVCSTIKTRYGDKIPSNGAVFDKDEGNVYNYYIYNYNKSKEQILFKHKIRLEGNEDIIANWEDRFNNGKPK